jgi:hypothetical protein
VCLYRSGVQWVVLNGRANQEEGGGAVCCDRDWERDNPKTFKQHYDHGGSLQLHNLSFSYKLRMMDPSFILR